jgi:hypothetical protein
MLVILFCLPQRAVATENEDVLVMADAQPLATEDMAEMRAGFIDPSGLIFSFGVNVQTQIDGALMYVRSLVLQADPAGQLTATANTQLLSQNLPAGVTANIINNGGGVQVTDKNGNTTIVNQTANGALANIIMNTANNRNVTQTMNIDLVLQHVQSIMGNVSGAGQTALLSGLARQSAHMHSVGLGF